MLYGDHRFPYEVRILAKKFLQDMFYFYQCSTNFLFVLAKLT